jgi:hypothetical protein
VRIRTDDEVYRVDAVWLGPPKATFPWRARYVSWGIGLAVFFITLTVERRLGISFGFFSVAWALVITIAITRLVGSKINHERPLGAVSVMWARELTAPRRRNGGQGGALTATRIKVNSERPRPKNSQGGGRRAQRKALPPGHASSGITAAGQSSGRQYKQHRQPQPQRRQVGTRTREVRGVRTPARP